MLFSIITPSYNQLDWLRLCVASVRDQVEKKSENLKIQNPERESPASLSGSNNDFSVSAFQRFSISVEHIIQDAGTPGIEDFAREINADFYRDGELQFAAVPNQQSAINNQQSTIPPPLAFFQVSCFMFHVGLFAPPPPLREAIAFISGSKNEQRLASTTRLRLHGSSLPIGSILSLFRVLYLLPKACENR